VTTHAKDAYNAIDETRGGSPGLHFELLVRATSSDGILDPTSVRYTWTIESPPDTSAHDTTITRTLGELTTERSASSASPAATTGPPGPTLAFECRLDSDAPADFRSGISPHSYADLGLGWHAVEVRAMGETNNPDPTPALGAGDSTAGKRARTTRPSLSSPSVIA
jgi:hypothetical protein